MEERRSVPYHLPTTTKERCLNGQHTGRFFKNTKKVKQTENAHSCPLNAIFFGGKYVKILLSSIFVFDRLIENKTKQINRKKKLKHRLNQVLKAR